MQDELFISYLPTPASCFYEEAGVKIKNYGIKDTFRP